MKVFLFFRSNFIHYIIVICEFCYNLQKTMWQRQWCIGCSSSVEILCPVLKSKKPIKNLKTFSKKPRFFPSLYFMDRLKRFVTTGYLGCTPPTYKTIGQGVWKQKFLWALCPFMSPNQQHQSIECTPKPLDCMDILKNMTADHTVEMLVWLANIRPLTRCADWM